ncbi:hypothetical protein H2204_015738, partial [Knufia peltigerae]
MSSGGSELIKNPQPKALGSDDPSKSHEENGRTDDKQANTAGYPSLPSLEGADATKPTPDRDGDLPMPDPEVNVTNEDPGAKTGAKSTNNGRIYTKEQRDE